MARAPSPEYLILDIETIPDVAGIRRLHGLPADLPEREVAEVAFQIRRTKTGSDFLPPQLHKVAVISCVLRGDEAATLSEQQTFDLLFLYGFSTRRHASMRASSVHSAPISGRV